MLSFDPIFADRAILQAEKPVKISGSGNGEITVKLGNISKTVSSSDGKWSVTFPAQDYKTICDIEAKTTDESVTAHGVTFGDVYLISGQSNMQFKLHEAKADGDIYECDDIRLFSTDRLEDNEYFKACDGWVSCTEETAPKFSAIGYYLARDLHKRDGRPIGLVACYQGASVIQSWLSQKALDELALDMPDGELHWDHHNPAFSKWNSTSVLYDFAFSQVHSLAFKAVIWYQGESNSSEIESTFYDKMLCRMIELWRRDLSDSELPFVVIQIADFDPRNDAPWHRVQSAQEAAVKRTENCYLIKCADICETNDIHPPTKHLIVKRILNVI